MCVCRGGLGDVLKWCNVRAHKSNIFDNTIDFRPTLKPVLNWANVCSPEHTSDTSTNYDSFLN